eukprot:COSAG04_NODE_3538_length_2726_cov_5.659307_1_plen_271_part_00
MRDRRQSKTKTATGEKSDSRADFGGRACCVPWREGLLVGRSSWVAVLLSSGVLWGGPSSCRTWPGGLWTSGAVPSSARARAPAPAAAPGWERGPAPALALAAEPEQVPEQVPEQGPRPGQEPGPGPGQGREQGRLWPVRRPQPVPSSLLPRPPSPAPPPPAVPSPSPQPPQPSLLPALHTQIQRSDNITSGLFSTRQFNLGSESLQRAQGSNSSCDKTRAKKKNEMKKWRAPIALSPSICIASLFWRRAVAARAIAASRSRFRSSRVFST